MVRSKAAKSLLKSLDGGRRCTQLDGLGMLNGLLEPSEEPSEEPLSSKSVTGSSSKGETLLPVVPRAKTMSPRLSQRRSSDRLHRGSTDICDDEEKERVIKEIRQLTLPQLPKQKPQRSWSISPTKKPFSLPDLPFVEKRSDDSPMLQALKEKHSASEKGRGSFLRMPKKEESKAQESAEESWFNRRMSYPEDGNQSPRKCSFGNYRDVFNSALPPGEFVRQHRRHSDGVLVAKKSGRRARTLYCNLRPISIIADSAVAALHESDAHSKLEVSSLSSLESNSSKESIRSTGSKDSTSRRSTESPLQQGSKIRASWRRARRILQAILPRHRIGLQRRYACEALRLFVFGEVGNELVADPKKKNETYYNGEGSPDQVKQLYQLWIVLDKDGSGRADICEFRDFCHRKGVTKMQQKHGDKVLEFLIGNNAIDFGIEDMMRILWPACTAEQLQQMLNMVQEYRRLDRLHDMEPLILPVEELDALTCIFRQLDEDNEGRISFEKLFMAGLLGDKDTLTRYQSEWDVSGDGHLVLDDFLAMMCPAGYRVKQDSRIGSDQQGNIVCLNIHENREWQLLEGTPKEWLAKHDNLKRAQFLD